MCFDTVALAENLIPRIRNGDHVLDVPFFVDDAAELNPLSLVSERSEERPHGDVLADGDRRLMLVKLDHGLAINEHDVATLEERIEAVVGVVRVRRARMERG